MTTYDVTPADNIRDDVFPVLEDGDTVLFGSGVYSQAYHMLDLPSSMQGVTFEAKVAGEVRIDGRQLYHPAILRGDSNAVIGINFCDSPLTTVNVSGTSIVLQDVVMWNGPSLPGNRIDGNHHIISLSGSTNARLVRVAGFGDARNTITAHKCFGASVDLGWFRTDGRRGNSDNVPAAVAPMYEATDTVMQGVVATASRSRTIFPESNPVQTRLFKWDRVPPDMIMPGLSLNDCYGYAFDEDCPNLDVMGITTKPCDGATIRELHLRMPKSCSRVAHFDAGYGGPRSLLERMTWSGGDPNRGSRFGINPQGWDKSEVYEELDVERGTPIKLDVMGRLRRRGWTEEFSRRIREATQQSQWPDADVEAELERAFG